MRFVIPVALLIFSACSSMPETHYERHTFPKDAYIGDVKERGYTVLGLVKTRVDYPTLDVSHEEQDLCRNYFNKGARDLLKLARQRGADAVLDVRSVVFFEDGKSKTYPSPECSDDGEEGQVLLQGIAVKWKPEAEIWASPTPAPSASTSERKALHSAIPVAARDWPLIPPSTQRYRSILLQKDHDGIEGGIRIVHDPADAKNPGQLILITMDRKILDHQPLDAQKAWFTTEYLRSPSERTIVLMREGPGAGELKAQLYDLHAGKLEVESYVDGDGNADHISLASGKHAAWRLVERPTEGGTQDILQITSTPDSNQVSYVRYHFSGVEKGWTRRVRGEAGRWESGQPFPLEENFPSTGKP